MDNQTENKTRFEQSLKFYTDKGCTTDNMRDDIKFRSLALKLGYEVIYGGNFGASLSFKKPIAGGYKIIWYTPYMEKNILYSQWRSANVINGVHEDLKNYRLYSDLESALKTEV
jgi:hypothetical protein